MHRSLSNAMMRLLTPIIFAVIPTQPFLCAVSVSNKSCADAQIVRCGRLGFLRQEKFVLADITDHGKTSAVCFYYIIVAEK